MENHAQPEAQLQNQLHEALASKGDSYQPRTRHLHSDGTPRHLNRLILEDSPYLLQHAHNPVNWFPWGSEAFTKAREEDKPIFISIGYSTCHWCHVMEHESFEDESIAKYLNEHFISIKVDRENHPDIDATYMTAVTLMNGQGGWPMSNFVTAEGKPFFTGTYYSPPQFTQVLKHLSGIWASNRHDIYKKADEITAEIIKQTSSDHTSSIPGTAAIRQAAWALILRHDLDQGGFGDAPKFPQEPILLFLLDQAERSYSPDIIEVITNTLTRMAQGGIYDQIGGGFHRYTTDNRWRVPHFEKMLYNQGHLAQLYVQAYQLTAKGYYQHIAGHTLDYVKKEMTAPGGGFFAATDADSEGAEGTFFVWQESQLKQLLDADNFQLARKIYGITSGGNFEGANILHLPNPLSQVADEQGQPINELLSSLETLNNQLYLEREKRSPPLRDDKIVTAWNGMMIKAFAQGSTLPGREDHLQTALNAAEFLWQHNQFEQGRLWRIHLNGRSSINARHEDYAFFADALIILYDLTEDSLWLERAQQVTQRMLELFWDESAGGFYMAARENEPACIARPKESADSALPASNPIAMGVLTALYERTGLTDYNDKAKATLQAFASKINQHPDAYLSFLLATSKLNGGSNKPFGYGAGGALKAHCRLTATDQKLLELEIKLTLKEGWFINADNEPHDENSHLRVELTSQPSWLHLADIEYPQADSVQIEGYEQTVYQGQQNIKVKFRLEEPVTIINDDALLRLNLKFQICQDKLCQPEETLPLAISCAPWIADIFD